MQDIFYAASTNMLSITNNKTNIKSVMQINITHIKYNRLKLEQM